MNEGFILFLAKSVVKASENKSSKADQYLDVWLPQRVKLRGLLSLTAPKVQG